MADTLRVANCSGFSGDRYDAFREQLEGGPIDVLTGDYLAELTMLILWRLRQREAGRGYATTGLRQVSDHLATIAVRGVKVVTNAGGLDPAGFAAAVREHAADARVDLRVAHLEGDDLIDRLDALRGAGEGLAHLDRGQPLGERPVLTANAYLGGWGIAAALADGADIVVCPRVADASLVSGPAAWHFGWARGDLDRLAGAVVAGHVLECGAQATGGNYSFFTEVDGLEHPGFPIAELHADGSSVITKHPGTGGEVSLGTVTAQLLYEIDQPGYRHPDVVARFDTIELTSDGPDRVRIRGVRGAAPSGRAKVAMTTFGGFRNAVTFLLTGLDIDEKAALVRRSLERRLDLDRIDEVEWRLERTDQTDAAANAAATATLTVTVTAQDREAVGRGAFSSRAVELALANYPGFALVAPPQDAAPLGSYWPTLIGGEHVTEVVVTDDGRQLQVPATVAGQLPRPRSHGPSRAAAVGSTILPDATVSPLASDRTVRAPLGRVVGARSGDKGGNANVGVWTRSAVAYRWLLSELTLARFRELLPETAPLEVRRYELANLWALNFVVVGLLGDGVAASTRPDPQAKGLGEYLRSRWVDVPAALLDPAC